MSLHGVTAQKNIIIKAVCSLKLNSSRDWSMCNLYCVFCVRFDSELQLLHDELRQEKQQKDRISREKELIIAEKYSLEQNLSVSLTRTWLFPCHLKTYILELRKLTVIIQHKLWSFQTATTKY
jgi:wyosine [tRNA(Phe)-imidazoG37] synthetase (radical SAM superfamily)